MANPSSDFNAKEFLSPKAANTLGEGQMDLSESDPLSVVGQRFQMGNAQVASSRQAIDLMNANLPDEERIRLLKQGVNTVSNGVNQKAYESMPWYSRAVADAAGTLPGIGDSFLQGTAGGAASAGIGLAGTALIPNPAIKAIAGGLTFSPGFTAGSAKSIWEQSAGELYQNLRLGDETHPGMDHNTAKLLSYTYGSLNASLEFLGFKVLKGIGGKAFSEAQKKSMQQLFTHPAVRKIESNMLGRFGLEVAKEVASETVTEGAQQGSSELAKVTGALLQKLPANTYTDWDTAKKNIQQAMLQALGASAILGGGAHIGGSVLGKAATLTKQQIQQQRDTLQQQLNGASPKQVLELLNKGLEQVPNAWEQEGSQDNKVVYDEQGRPFIQASATAQGPSEPATIKLAGQLKLKDIIQDPQVLIQEGLQALYPQEIILPPDQIKTGTEEKQLRIPLVEWRSLNQDETQARVNQITTDTNLLKREEQRLESQILLKEQSGAAPASLIQQWRNLTNNIEHLNSEKQLLEEGLGTTDLQGPNYGRLRIKKLSQLFDKITSQAIKLQQQIEKLKTIPGIKRQQQQIGFKQGTFQTERKIRRLQADLTNLVSSVTDDKEIRAKVRQYINSVTTPEQAVKAAQQIKNQALKFENQKIETQNEGQRKKVFDKVVKMLQGQAVKLQSGYPTAKLPVDVVNKLEILRGFLKDKKGLKNWFEEYNQTYGQMDITQLPQDVADKLQLATMANNLYNGDPLTANVTAGNIAQWVADGKAIIAQKKEQLTQQKEADIQTASVSLNVNPNPTRNWTTNAGQRRKQFLNDINSGVLTWNSLLDILSSSDPQHNLTQQLDVTRARRNFLVQKDLAVQNLQNFIAQNLKDRGIENVNVLQKFAEDQKNKYAVTYTKANGQTTTETFTKAQIIDSALKIRDESLHSALTDDKTGNGWTLRGQVEDGKSFQEIIESTLDESDKAVIDSLLEFYRDYHQSINGAYREKFGYDLPMRDNYSPVSRIGFKVDAPMGEEGLQYWNLLPGSAKTRQESKLAIAPRNPIEDAINHINQWEHFRTYDEVITRMRNVFENPEIRQHIKNEYGSGTMKTIDSFITDFVKNEATPRSPFWDMMSGDLSRYALGLRPLSSVMTQLSSGTMLWENYNPGQLIKGIAQTIAHPIATEKSLRESKILENRFKSGPSVDLETALKQQGLFGSMASKILGHEPEAIDIQKYNLYNRLLFAGIISGDAGAARVFGGPIYWAERNSGKSHDEALLTVERLMEQTQQGTDPSQVPRMMKNPAMRTIFGMFTQQPTQAYGRALAAVSDFANQPKTPGNWLKLGHKMATIWVVPGILLGLARAVPQLIAPPPGSQDEDKNRELATDLIGSTLLGPLNGLPLVGDMLEVLWLMAAKPIMGTDKTKLIDYYGKNPLMSMLISDPYRAFKAWEKVTKAEDEFKLPSLSVDEEEQQIRKAQLLTAKAILQLAGLPGQLGNLPIVLENRLSEGDTVGAAQAIGGWSPGAIKKREAPADDLFTDPLKDLNKDETIYDKIIEYFRPMMAQKPQDSQDSTNDFVDGFIKELNKK